MFTTIHYNKYLTGFPYIYLTQAFGTCENNLPLSESQKDASQFFFMRVMVFRPMVFGVTIWLLNIAMENHHFIAR